MEGSPAGPGQPAAELAGPVLDQSLREYLEVLSARVAAPGGGSAAALTGAMAAGLVAMAARFSQRQMPDSAALAEQADALRERAVALADQDASVSRAVVVALRQHRQGAGSDGLRHRATALQGAAEVPMEIAETAAQVAKLAMSVAAQGNPSLRGDALAAAHLAVASARSAATLVGVNAALGDLPGYLTRRAGAAVAAAQAAVSRVSQLCTPGTPSP